MRARHAATIALTAAAAFLLLTATGTVAASNTQIVISDVEVSDDSPETGETVTVTTTVENLDDSTTIELTQVSVADHPVGSVNKARELGALGPGDSLSVPLTVSFDEPGSKNLRAHVRGVEYEGGQPTGTLHHVKYPFHVSVSEPSSSPDPTPPRIDVGAGSAAAGGTATAEVTVSNPSDSAVTDLAVEMEGENVELHDSSEISPRLKAYNTTEFEFDYTPEQGEVELTATLSYEGGEVSDTVTDEVSAGTNETDLETDAGGDSDGFSARDSSPHPSCRL